MAYSQEQIEAHKATICKRIAEGESLRAICKAKDLPSAETVRVWLSEDRAFSAQYARAREDQADFYADEIIEIADSTSDPNKARVQIDARKWKASKLQPKKYGDKIDVNHSGSIQTMSEEQVDARLSELLGKAGVGRASGAQGQTEGDEQA